MVSMEITDPATGRAYIQKRRQRYGTRGYGNKGNVAASGHALRLHDSGRATLVGPPRRVLSLNLDKFLNIYSQVQ